MGNYYSSGKRRPRQDDDFFEDGDLWSPPVGGVNSFHAVLKGADAPRRPREFPPGFHGANPGPSHDDTYVPVKRTRAPAKKARK